MSLQDTDVLHVVPAKEFSAGKVTDVSPIYSGSKVKLPPFCAGDFVLIGSLEDLRGAFLEALEGSFPTASCALGKSVELFIEVHGVVPIAAS
jgi:hypothetical protein